MKYPLSIGERKSEPFKVVVKDPKGRCDELIARRDWAEIYEVHSHYVDKDNDNQVRIYCRTFPDVFLFQIRTYKPIAGEGMHGKPRNMIANVTLSIDDVRSILAYMEAEKEK